MARRVREGRARWPRGAGAVRRAPGARGGRLLFALSLLVGLPLLALCALTLVGPPSFETSVFAGATLVAVVGGFMSPRRKGGAYAALIGFVVMVGVIVYRLFEAAEGASVSATTGPSGARGRLVDRLLPERDVAIGGSALLMAIGAMPEDQPGLLDALRGGYSRMRRAEGPVPSPVLGTFLFGQASHDYALLSVVPPLRTEPAAGAVVFLHGSMGNVTLLCWEVAQAANPLGLDVVCPSAGPEAAWAGPDGAATVKSTVRALRDGGAPRIILAGLSAGAIGVSRVAASLDVDGVILISGASEHARPAALPTLVLIGALDRMTPPGPARAYAQAVGSRAEYHEHPQAGHWLILSDNDWTQAHLRRWLAERTADPPGVTR